MNELRRELGLRDLTLFAITGMMATRWIASAAHAGPGSVTLWVITAACFVVPLAIATASLTVKYPGAGGLYLWTRGDFGPWHAFLCCWVYWMGIAAWFPSASIFYMSAGVHAAGLPESRLVVLAAALAAVWIGLGTNLVGMNVGKWTENIGGAAAWIVSGLFVLLAILVWMKRGAATTIDIRPRWNWETFNSWSTIVYAMSGVELAGMMNAEIRDPKRTLPIAASIASAGITVFYVSATIALLVLLPPGKISDLNGLAEAGEEAARVLHAAWIGPVITLLVLGSGLGQLGGIGTGVSRLPFAAAADGLLPKVFARVHPRWRTPHLSILCLGTVATFLLVAIQLGDTLRAAYDASVSLMVITGFLPFYYVFASSWKAGNRTSAASGMVMVSITLLCAIIPTADVRNVWLFEGKLAAGTLAVIGSAWLVYRERRI